MIKKLKAICISSLIIPSIMFSNTAVVNTDILLVKKKPSNKSSNNRYYEMNKVIDIQEKVSGLDTSEKWYKTNNGYVKAKYILLDKDLPQFIDESEVDYDKYALQLIVYKSTVVQSLVKLRKLLVNENNIFLQESKNVYVIYLVNFDSYHSAFSKSKDIKNIFRTNFITKIKKVKQKIKQINNELLSREKKLQSLVKPKKEDVFVSKKEKIVLENKVILKRPDNNGIKKIRNLESIKVVEMIQKKTVNNLNFEPKIKAPSYEEMLENILIELSK